MHKKVVDHVSRGKRSEIMRAVRGKHTTPEMVVRKAAHSLGLRFRLHRANLPGKPDLVFPKWNTVVFVNGCFWHRHNACKKATFPKTNTNFWKAKFNRNVERDKLNKFALRELGWHVVTIWQCEVPNEEKAKSILIRRLMRKKHSCGDQKSASAKSGKYQ